MQNSGEPAKPNRSDGLYSSNSKLKERGDDSRYVCETRPYVSAKMHPLLTAGLAVGGGLAIAALWNTFGRTRHHTDVARQLSQYSGSHQQGLNQQSVDQSFTDDFNRRSADRF